MSAAAREATTKARRSTASHRAARRSVRQRPMLARSSSPCDQAGRRSVRPRRSPDTHCPQEPHQCLSLLPINWSPRSTRWRVPPSRIKPTGSARLEGSRSSARSLKSFSLAADPRSSIGTALKTRWSMSLPVRSPSSRARPRPSCAPVTSQPSEPVSRSGTIWRTGAALQRVAWSSEPEHRSIGSPTRSTIGSVCEIDRCQTTYGLTWPVSLHPARTRRLGYDKVQR